MDSTLPYDERLAIAMALKGAEKLAALRALKAEKPSVSTQSTVEEAGV